MRPMLLIVAVAAVLAGVLVWLASSEDGGGTPIQSTALVPSGDHGRGDETVPAEDAPRVEPTVPVSDGPEDDGRRATGPTRRDAEPTPVVAVRGRIVDERGRGLGARVLLGPGDRGSSAPVDAREGFLETASDRSGAFELELEPGAGTSGLAVRAPGFADYDRSGIALPASGELALGDITLLRGVIAQGQVLDDLGRAVGGASVHRGFRDDRGNLARGGLLTLTGARGEFAVNTLPAGPLLLVVVKTGHQRGTYEGISSAPGERVTGIEITMAVGGSIAGRVVDENGASAGGAGEARTVVVALDRASAGIAERPRVLASVEVAADGSFEIAGLPTDHSAWLRARAPEPAQPARWLSEPVEVVPGDRIVSLAVEPASAVSLRIAETRGGPALLPDVLVARARSGGEAVRVEEVRLVRDLEWRAKPDGDILIERLPWTSGGRPDGLLVTIEAGVEGRAVDSPPFRPRPGGVVELGDLLLGGEGAIRVRVTATSSGQPVPGARVHLEPWATAGERERLVQNEYGFSPAGSRAAETDSVGFARLPGPVGRLCRLWAEHPDHSPSRDFELTVRADGGDVVDLLLAPPTAAVVTVVDPRRIPLLDRTVRQMYVRPGESSPVSFRGATTDAEGRVRFDGLRPGTHRFSLDFESDAGRRAFQSLNPRATSNAALEVVISAGTTGDITLIAAPIVSLSGQVTQAGEPLPGATVRVYEDEQDALDAEAGFSSSEIEAVTDGAGRYRIEGLVPGKFTVAVAHARRAMPRLYNVTLANGNTRCNFPLEVLVVSGRVTGSDGSPIAGASVRVERVTGEEQEEMPDWIAAELATGAVEHGAARATTNAAGEFELVGVGKSWLSVVVEGDLLVSTRSSPFEIEDGETETFVEIEASVGGAIRARLESSSGELGGYQLMAHPLGVVAPEVGRRTSSPSKDEGSLVIAGIHPGRYRVECLRMFSQAEPLVIDEVVVEAGRTVELDFRVR